MSQKRAQQDGARDHKDVTSNIQHSGKMKREQAQVEEENQQTEQVINIIANAICGFGVHSFGHVVIHHYC